ncbi:MAG: PIN domain-containing protein [Acidobacteria bacterium]|nr:PIN domain-containing protein [Acidobacteriota bacterium]NIM63425.1 PIN domain-containing protein [Acidobacteriota bacterium]NIO58356.1 PIN domain-containing protein [Acidobacteriota bacterium]NIQ31155.1 PIN domain-containing protein [Acidobacteriota bacterium]NIQ84027.1 PIN domain-containing protein [Acidobacteriota bacterium]
MIIVDSNAWADFFNGTSTPHVHRLDAALAAEEDLAVLPIIVTEVLRGFRTESGFRRARRVLVALPSIQPDVECHVRAAHLFRSLRKRGITLRGAVDAVIAQTCLDVDAELLSPDADFRHIATHTPLRLWGSTRG